MPGGGLHHRVADHVSKTGVLKVRNGSIAPVWRVARYFRSTSVNGHCEAGPASVLIQKF